jgi:hypothetical protein
VVVVVVVNVVGDGDGDELNDASSGRADGHEPIWTQSESVRLARRRVCGASTPSTRRARFALSGGGRDAIGPSSTSTGTSTGVSTGIGQPRCDESFNVKVNDNVSDHGPCSLT